MADADKVPDGADDAGTVPRHALTAQQVLKRVYGYDTFRPGQRQVIDSVLSGRDTMAIMPTGGGKSLCYQIPAAMFAGFFGNRPIGMTLVISPLISLMQDQVEALRSVGVPGAYLNSSLSPERSAAIMRAVRERRITILYCAPERLARREFRDLISSMPIALVAVDEAHCVSHWGHDFRPDYRQIRDFTDACAPHAVRLALTATATVRVRDDIISSLQLRRPAVFQTTFDRPNLWFGVRKLGNREKDQWILDYALAHSDESGIVYCARTKEVDELARMLASHGVSAAPYHAKLDADTRKATQSDFIHDRIRVIVATNAFGMGIDKPDVRYVVHHNLPGSIEAYYQEAGRAGRDGDPGRCMLLWNGSDVNLRSRFIDMPGDAPRGMDPEEADGVRRTKRAMLDFMVGYCGTTHCLRGMILRYFGEEGPESCHNCSNCDGRFEAVDVTDIARAISRCVHDMRQSTGRGTIANVLHGVTARGGAPTRGLARDHSALPTFGALKRQPIGLIRDVMTQMIADGYLAIHTSDAGYPLVVFGPRAAETADAGFAYSIKRDASSGMPRSGVFKPVSEAMEPSDQGLFEQLRELRKQIAREANVPPYVVFSDRTLRDMAQAKPATDEEFLAINGVGEKKLERYGGRFMDMIAAYGAEGKE
ncbi:MAG: DNA helicase RecQ [Bifidobacteriaceae bacterium]|nr:DNA helicase RecQ [Bifidobacteriaceae bacterium]